MIKFYTVFITLLMILMLKPIKGQSKENKYSFVLIMRQVKLKWF
jgi:hypothetical protein